MFKMETSGFDELQKKLKQLGNSAKQIDGENKVTLDELLTPAFMKEYTQCTSLDDLLTSGGYNITTPEEFQAVLGDEWDKHIQAKTRFASWQEMLNQAGSNWTIRQLGL